MTVPLSRADSVREYITGAASDGSSQDQPDLSLGSYRSSSEAMSLGIRLGNPLQGVVVQAAAGANPTGQGVLTCTDGYTLYWRPANTLTPGPGVIFPPAASTLAILEGMNPAQFLRVLGTPPFTIGACFVRLETLLGNVFGLNIVPDASASAGISQYRATMLRNESPAAVTGFARWIQELATTVPSDQQQLPASGPGTLQSSHPLIGWPTAGWCQIRQAGGSLRELIYYQSRTLYALTVSNKGRGQLGTSAAAGVSTDTLHAVPGIAIGLDPAGVQAFGSSIQKVSVDTTAPTSVSWSLGITQSGGIQVPSLPVGTQIGIWIWRELPSGCVFSPNVYSNLNTIFQAY